MIEYNNVLKFSIDRSRTTKGGNSTTRMIALEAVVLFILICINGAFALTELAVVSARRARLMERAESGDCSAQIALEYLEEPSRFLSTVQIGITLVGILAGAFGGATLSHNLSGWFQQLGMPAATSEVIGFGLVVLVITYLTLVIGELVPKRIALTDPTAIALRVAPMLRVLGKITSPVTKVLSASTEFVVKIIGIKRDESGMVSDEEVTMLLKQGIQSGHFEETELEIVEQIFKLSERTINTIMTPRNELVWISTSDAPEQIFRKVVGSYRSRFPVCGEHIDDVLGMIELKALFALLYSGDLNELSDLSSALRQPTFVSEQASVIKVIEQLRDGQFQSALVVDEYGSVQGLVTSNDILKSLLGILASGSPTEPDFIDEAGDEILMRGGLSLAEMSEYLDIRELPVVAHQISTLGGLAMVMLDRIPTAGDKFRLNDFTFEIIEMDGHRVERVRVVRK